MYKSKKQYETLLEEHVAQLSSQQQLLYATNRHAILLIFQAMDAAGKDGAIKHVMSGVNLQGCQVFSFKHPSAAGPLSAAATQTLALCTSNPMHVILFTRRGGRKVRRSDLIIATRGLPLVELRKRSIETCL